MKRNMKKKAFTLVELLVVIAILAILATVSVVGYTSFIERANLSVDQQAVTQINNALMAQEQIDKPTTQRELFDVLEKTELDVEDYKPLSKDLYFYWVKNINRVVLADKDNKVLYPEDLTGATYSAGNWYSLSGYVPMNVELNNVVSSDANKVTANVDSGDQLVAVMDAVVEQAQEVIKEEMEVVLSGTVDMQGANSGFGEIKNVTTVTVDGGNKESTTLFNQQVTDGVTKSMSVGTGTQTSYGFGMFGTIPKGQTVTVSNITIDGSNIYNGGTLDSSGVGAIAGNVAGNLVIDNITIRNCHIEGSKKVGLLVGMVQKTGKVTIKNVTVENCAVAGSVEVAKLIGYVFDDAVVEFGTINIDGLTVSHIAEGKYATTAVKDGVTLVRFTKNSNTTWRIGVTDAYCWRMETGTNAIYKGNDSSSGEIVLDDGLEAYQKCSAYQCSSDIAD